MEQFFTRDYTGAPFEMFGTAHLIAIGVIALIGLSFIPARRVWGENAKRRFRYAMAIWMFVWEIAFHAWGIYFGTFSIQTNLPFHLCSVFVWLTIVMMINKNKTIYEFAYFLGIGGAVQALLTPDVGIYGFPHFRAFQTFATHGGIILAALYMTIIEGYRPTWKSFKPIIIWSNIYVVIVFFINLAIGSNYLMIAHKPDFPTLIDMLAPWPWYIPEMEVLGLAICFILYIPFMVKDRAGSRQPATT